MESTNVDVRQLGQDLFGEDNKRREISALETARDEAISEATTEEKWTVVDALDDLLNEKRPRRVFPECIGLPHSYTAERIDAIARFIGRFLVLPDSLKYIMAVWVLLTYVYRHFYCVVYLFITAAEKACGKSLALDVLRVLVYKPLRTGGATAAALLRLIDRGGTALLDEMDSQTASNPEWAAAVQGILNEGYVRHGVFIKCEGKNNELREFSCYGPKAFAGIGEHLHDTTASRSIRIELRRKTASEHVELFDMEQAEKDAAPIRASNAQWAKTIAPGLRMFRHGQVEGFDGRQNDITRPLLTIALFAGHKWFTRIRSALQLALQSNAEATQSFGTQLLSDCRDYFDLRHTDRASTADLLEYLHELEERPWVAWGFKRERMQHHQLAKELKKYRISSRQIRIGSRTVKGYLRTDFEDSWQRFCPVQPAVTEPQKQPDDNAMVEI